MSYLICLPTGRRWLYPAEKSQDCCTQRCSGFTVLEILIVVVILAIASVMVVPMMSSASSFQIRSAANIIAADLEYAKSLAISRGKDYAVIFNPAAESYQIEDLSKPVGDSKRIIDHPIKKGFKYIINFQNDSRLDKVDIYSVDFDGNLSVKFDYLGSPDNTSEGEIILMAGGTTMKVKVVPVTGYIRIEE